MKSKQLTIGILAHVDAGKTTLSESILYDSGSIRKIGRVDHGNAFLDTDQLERARGITIFSKQARFRLGEKEAVLLDTPGHVDFSAEMERTLQVLDYAVLVINGADGVQSHTLTLWSLLKHYQIPVFIFVNKMDQNGADRKMLQKELQQRLAETCIDFRATGAELFDELAMCDELLLEPYLQNASLSQEQISEAITRRKVFPCYYGSALRNKGIKEFLEGMNRYTLYPEFPPSFGAKVYKITRDAQGNRLTHMKITGGTLKVKDLLANRGEDWKEKVDQIRLYSGIQFETAAEVEAGTVCAVAGLSKTRAGENLGEELSLCNPLLEPVLTYQIQLPEGCDAHSMLEKLRLLEEEEPHLHIGWNEQLGEIHVQVMGEIEIEILKSMIKERFQINVEFGAGTVVYKETIASPVEGIGHFEPLRHYAEVHLLLEAGKPGSGLQFESKCSEDQLDRNWQRLILAHLKEKEHRGVLTGSEITDMKISLIAGSAHKKHTEGGDFRQATYRAVRQGLRKAKSILLEPIYEFSLEVPAAAAGRAMSDIQRMNGCFGPPETKGGTSIITGTAPVALMGSYHQEVAAYTKGRGRLHCMLKGYGPCHNWQEIIKASQYDPEQDLENPTGSVFCAHGAGFNVKWDEVEAHMHVDSGWRPAEADSPPEVKKTTIAGSAGYGNDAELEEIFQRTYGPIKRANSPFQKSTDPTEKELPRAQPQKMGSTGQKETYLLVDGYNIIFSWDELKELAQVNLDSAREKLVEILSNYQGYKGNTLIVVFDAYKVEGGKGSVEKHGELHVIYTKEAETADQYIERAVNKIGRGHDVTVATSDQMVQMIIWGEGAMRLSAQGFKEEVELVNEQIRKCLR